MKKISLLTLSLLLMLFFVVSCNNQETTNKGTNADEKEAPVSHMVSTVELNSIDDLVKYAYTVVYGTVIDVEPFSEGTSEYLFQVHKELKTGLDAEEIYVYEVDETLDVGESYLLFLSSFTESFAPHTIYTSINKETILKIDNNDITHNSSYLPQDMTLAQTMKDIANSPNLSNQIQTESDFVLLRDASLDELADDADIIAEIIPIKFTFENKYTKVAEVKVTKNHKGQLETGASVFMPAPVELEKEYLVYLKNDAGALIVNSIDNGVIKKSDHEKWDEAMQLLED